MCCTHLASLAPRFNWSHAGGILSLRGSKRGTSVPCAPHIGHSSPPSPPLPTHLSLPQRPSARGVVRTASSMANTQVADIYQATSSLAQFPFEPYWPDKKLRICITGAGGFIARCAILLRYHGWARLPRSSSPPRRPQPPRQASEE